MELKRLIAPAYYGQFKCIAQLCRHSCCKGWEIDIDQRSLARYRELGIGGIEGAEGQVAGSADMPAESEEASAESEGPSAGSDETPHFALTSEGACVHLRADGLCELICRYGEGILCDICRDHPLFRSFWSDRVELGLGLSCEEAARIILGSESPMELVEIGLCDGDGIPVILYDEPKRTSGHEDGRSGRAQDRDEELQNACEDGPVDAGEASSGGDAELPDDERWLIEFRERMLAEAAALEDPMEARLAEYLIYRQIPDALYDDRLEERIAFVNRGLNEIAGMWESCESFEERCEAARSWSERNEYRV